MNQDTASGLYDADAREYSIQGRWPSPDSAGLSSVHPTDPQTLDRYAYARNNPLSFTDPTGTDWWDWFGGGWGGGGGFGGGIWDEHLPWDWPLDWQTLVFGRPRLEDFIINDWWSPPAHDKIFEHSLSGCATPSDIKLLQAASRDFDRRTSAVAFAPLHSMRAPNQSPQKALSIRDSFSQQTLSQAVAAQQAGIHGQAMTLLAESVHPTADSTSIIHVSSHADPLVWGDLSRLDDYFHSPGDYWGDETSNMLAFGSPRFNKMEDQIRDAYKKVMGGCTADKKN